MNKQEYLNELSRHLKGLSAQDVEEILADYKEHFMMGQRAGKTEEEIADSLGNPRAVVQGYLANSLVNEAKSSSSDLARLKILIRIMLLVLVLAPFNFLVFICPFVVLSALLIAGWAIPIAIGGVGLAIAGTVIATGTMASLGLLLGLSFLFMFLGIEGIALLAIIVMIVITKLFISGIVSYLKWNINFIIGRQA